MDDEEKYIEIWDLISRKIIRYKNLSFELLGETKINNSINFSNGLKLKNGDYLLSTNYMRNEWDGEETNAPYFLADKNGNLLKRFFDVKYKNESRRDQILYTLFTFRMVKNDSKEVFATLNFDNHLFQFEKSNFVPIAKINYLNGPSVNNQDLLKMDRMDQMNYFTQSDEFIKTASFPNVAINNSNLLVINYRYREKPHGPMLLRHYIYLKKKDKVIHAKSIRNDLSNYPSKIQISYSNSDNIHCRPWYDNYIVSMVSPASEIEVGSSIHIDSIGEIKASDNPIIVLMKLRK